MHLWASCAWSKGAGCVDVTRSGRVQEASNAKRMRCSTAFQQRGESVPLTSPAASRTARTCPWPPAPGWGCRWTAGRWNGGRGCRGRGSGGEGGCELATDSQPLASTAWLDLLPDGRPRQRRKPTMCTHLRQQAVPTLASSSLPFHTLVRPLYSYRRSLHKGDMQPKQRWRQSPATATWRCGGDMPSVSERPDTGVTPP